jgi:hypothetical protein
MRRIITTGMNVIVSLNVRLRWRGKETTTIHKSTHLSTQWRIHPMSNEPNTHRKVRTSLGFNVYP